MVVNDIGPFIPKEALLKIADYIGLDPKFKSKEELVAYSQEKYGAFGGRKEDWDYLFPFSYRELKNEEKGGDPSLLYALHYDPKVKTLPPPKIHYDTIQLTHTIDRGTLQR